MSTDYNSNDPSWHATTHIDRAAPHKKTREEITRQTTETTRSNREKRKRQLEQTKNTLLPKRMEMILDDVFTFTTTYHDTHEKIFLSAMMEEFIAVIAVPKFYYPVETLYAGLLMSATPGVMQCLAIAFAGV